MATTAVLGLGCEAGFSETPTLSDPHDRKMRPIGQPFAKNVSRETPEAARAISQARSDRPSLEIRPGCSRTISGGTRERGAGCILRHMLAFSPQVRDGSEPSKTGQESRLCIAP